MNQLYSYLDKYHIRQYVTSPDITFRLLRYEKDEILNSPVNPLKDILFVVEGSIAIYGLRFDGSMYHIHLAKENSVLGDLEFCHYQTSHYTQAATPVVCIAIDMERYRTQLESDPVFLRFLLQITAQKVSLFSNMDLPSQTLEEKVLSYLRYYCPDHIMPSVKEAVIWLHCSRRQLQRVLSELCEKGYIQKIGKGKYQMISIE